MGLPVRDNLDANDIAGLEEVFPSFDGVGGTGQLADSAIQRCSDRGRVALAAD